MPQLDKFTFLDQSLSVLVILLVIYIINMYVFLPKIIFILKFRNRLFSFLKKRNKLLEIHFIWFKKMLDSTLFYANSTTYTCNTYLVEVYRDYLLLVRFLIKKTLNK